MHGFKVGSGVWRIVHRSASVGRIVGTVLGDGLSLVEVIPLHRSVGRVSIKVGANVRRRPPAPDSSVGTDIPTKPGSITKTVTPLRTQAIYSFAPSVI